MAQTERRGVIYTIEFDADGNLVRWESKPAPIKNADFFDPGTGRRWTLLFSAVGAALLLGGVCHSDSGYIGFVLAGGGLLSVFTALGIFLHTVQSYSAWIRAEDFMEDWRIDRRKRRGYKYHEHSGCYVIATYREKPQTPDDLAHYDNIYVGQSLRVYQRVYSHLCGRGNGEVYGDIKYGMHAYVRIVKCRPRELNELERSLIARYHAIDSYNRTRGGAGKWN